MAPSSITKNFIISGQKQMEMFVDTIEASAKNHPVRTPVAVRLIDSEDELIEYYMKSPSFHVRRIDLTQKARQ